MKNEQFVFGKNLQPDEKKRINKNILGIKESAKQRIEGEYEKNPEELKFISMANGFIQEELRQLGLPAIAPLEPEQFHLLTEKAYDELGPDKDFVAFVQPMESAAYINKDEARHRLELYKTILHEAVHLATLEKNQVRDNDDDRIISNYRFGYGNTTGIEDAFGENHEHFRGFNEAITDLIVLDMLNKHEDELISKLKIKPEEEQLPVVFINYRKLITNIIHKIAEKQNENYDDVWKRFKKGAFTGEMMHLRDVERTFGKGSLRFLAAIYSGTKDYSAENDEEIFRFFETSDAKERVKIAKEVLDEREGAAFQKRRS